MKAYLLTYNITEQNTRPVEFLHNKKHITKFLKNRGNIKPGLRPPNSITNSKRKSYRKRSKTIVTEQDYGVESVRTDSQNNIISELTLKTTDQLGVKEEYFVITVQEAA